GLVTLAGGARQQRGQRAHEAQLEDGEVTEPVRGGARGAVTLVAEPADQEGSGDEGDQHRRRRIADAGDVIQRGAARPLVGTAHSAESTRGRLRGGTSRPRRTCARRAGALPRV